MIQECFSNEGIALLSIVLKAYEHILEGKLRDIAEQELDELNAVSEKKKRPDGTND